MNFEDILLVTRMLPCRQRVPVVVVMSHTHKYLLEYSCHDTCQHTDYHFYTLRYFVCLIRLNSLLSLSVSVTVYLSNYIQHTDNATTSTVFNYIRHYINHCIMLSARLTAALCDARRVFSGMHREMAAAMSLGAVGPDRGRTGCWG